MPARSLIERLIELLAPKPQPRPIPVRVDQSRRR
jgi:hypothetical protein